MTERFIQGGDSYSSRYLHSDEKFRKAKNWNINLPNEREFKSGECIVTDKDYTAYHIDELVTLLNELHDENEQLKSNIQDMQTGTYINARNIIRELKEENEQLKQQINTMIKDLQTEKETAISKNERIRLDFAITVLEELKR